MNVTYIIALLSGAIDPEIGLIDHCPILRPAYYFPPLPPFLASFLTYLTSFLGAPLAFLSCVAAVAILLAAYNLASLYFCIFSKSSFLNY